MKILYFDVETTGTDPVKNSIVQLSGLIEINHKVVDKFNIECRPREGAEIHPKALQVTGLTAEQLMAREKTYADAYDEFLNIMKNHVYQYHNSPDTLMNEKFYPCAFNGYFDLQFVAQFFTDNGDRYGFGNWQNWQLLDPLPLVRFMEYAGLVKMDDHKLGTVCASYNIPIKAHDAFSDISATRDLVQKLTTLYKDKFSEVKPFTNGVNKHGYVNQFTGR